MDFFPWWSKYFCQKFYLALYISDLHFLIDKIYTWRHVTKFISTCLNLKYFVCMDLVPMPISWKNKLLLCSNFLITKLNWSLWMGLFKPLKTLLSTKKLSTWLKGNIAHGGPKFSTLNSRKNSSRISTNSELSLSRLLTITMVFWDFPKELLQPIFSSGL